MDMSVQSVLQICMFYLTYGYVCVVWPMDMPVLPEHLSFLIHCSSSLAIYSTVKNFVYNYNNVIQYVSLISLPFYSVRNNEMGVPNHHTHIYSFFLFSSKVCLSFLLKTITLLVCSDQILTKDYGLQLMKAFCRDFILTRKHIYIYIFLW